MDNMSYIEKFKKMVWKFIGKKEQEKLIKHFFGTDINNKVDDIDKILALKCPCPFIVTSMHVAKRYSAFLINYCESDDEMFYRLDFDKFKVGALLGDDEYMGLFEKLPFEDIDKKLLERLVKSSLSFNIYEKMLLVGSVLELKKSFVIALMENIKNEMEDIYVQFANKSHMKLKPIIEKIEKNKQDWLSVKDRLKAISEGDMSAIINVDKFGDILPSEISYNIKRKVKGQDEAIDSMSIHMYLQHKVMRELCNDKTPSFRIDPVMVVGETGNGKSFMIKSFCEFMSMNYIHIDASSMVPNGIKGNSIDSMLKNIIRESKNDINKAKSYVVVLDEFDKLLYSNDVYNSTILNQLLRLIEGSEYPLEKSSSEDIAEFKDIDSLDTTYMFFILVGSFQQYKDTMPSCSGFLREENSSSYEEVFEYSQVPKELEGRIKEVIVLNKLDKNSMVDILKGESSPIKKYDNMLKYIDSSFYCDDDMIEEIATEAINSEYGARVLDQLVFSRYKKHLFGKNSTPKKQNIKDIFALKLKQQYSVA